MLIILIIFETYCNWYNNNNNASVCEHIINIDNNVKCTVNGANNDNNNILNNSHNNND